MDNHKPSFPKVQSCWLGRVDYRRAWHLQARLAAAVASQIQPPSLLMLEHPPTFTMGRSGSWDHLLWDQEELAGRGLDVIEVDRGGDITYHGPGQLVLYPILPLGQLDASGRLPGPDYLDYIQRLERVVIKTVKRWGIKAEPISGFTGVWLKSNQPAKLAAIGVKVDANGISRHGAALNVDPEMSYWQGIVPCGISRYPVTSIAEVCQSTPTMLEVRAELVKQFAEVFECELTKLEARELMSRLAVEPGTA